MGLTMNNDLNGAVSKRRPSVSGGERNLVHTQDDENVQISDPYKWSDGPTRFQILFLGYKLREELTYSALAKVHPVPLLKTQHVDI